MSAERNLPSAGGEFERGFGWTLALSAAAHVALLGALVLVPGFVLRPEPPLLSYTVDLIDPSRLGGTNVVAGSKGKVAAPPKVEPAKAAPPEPPPEVAKVEPPPPPPPPEPKVEPPPPPAKEEVKPPEPPKVEEDLDAVALEKKSEPTKPRSTPTAAPVKAAPTSAPKVVAKAKATATAVKVAAKAAPPTAAKPVAAATKPVAKTTPVKPGAKAAPPKPDAKAPPATPAAGVDPQGRDDRIAAAIKRIEQQAGARGGGSGGGAGDGPGGPISIGPGEGAGGEVRGIAFIMYINRIEAMIKQKWVWGGPDRSLKADIGFAVLPSGEVVDVRTVVSSGDPTYDRSAETAVRAASPLLPPPEEYQTEFATVGFVYTFEPN